MKHQIKDKLSAIEKTLEILVSFADVDHELGTVEVSELTGIHKATVSRILSTLLDYGMVSQNDDSKKYTLGPMAYRLGRSQTSQSISTFASLAHQYIDELRDALSETISLEIWAENKSVACYLAESKHPLRVTMPAADVLPLHAPAGAKAVLSFVGQDHLDRLLPDSFPAFTENTITSKQELLERLIEFNKQGYSVDDQELYPGIYAIGVPIFDQLSRPVAAISAVMPVSRVTAERKIEVVRLLKSTSRAVSKAINEVRPFFPFR
jgi:DNA-binding IclR family transcriptional regulator